ncbi:hypothetical protein [Rhodoferax aquaticus]|uniref:Uncharacterized protein n=1 Tax=Rhodoferax aquaticus TaxID=2527691 RepID=A0A515EN54_9BURK|nr:hypothetical protein [Rhodoferax aquaticus]QDL54093.1 hypothetical protein EXZ61_07870 [Rhodoferax aquaticus]
MYLVPIAWIYVALMMSVAEATNTNGTVLGAIFTFVLYGLMPVGLVVYIMGTPGRKRAIKARELAERQAAEQASPQTDSVQPNASGLAPTDPVAPVREEPR